MTAVRARGADAWVSVFFNDTATTEIYTLSLHDALPISQKGNRTSQLSCAPLPSLFCLGTPGFFLCHRHHRIRDRKSTRLNSSHANISNAVFCLKKKRISPRSRLSLPADFISCRHHSTPS